MTPLTHGPGRCPRLPLCAAVFGVALAPLAACQATAPDFDPLATLDVVEFTPASQPFGYVTTGYAAAWSRMERCSGLTGDLAGVRFYVTTDPHVYPIPTPWGPAGAVYLVD